jgi:hypothetical protein
MGVFCGKIIQRKGAKTQGSNMKITKCRFDLQREILYTFTSRGIEP